MNVNRAVGEIAMDVIWEQIKALAEDGDGFIRTGQVEDAGISRPMLKKYMEEEKLERVRKGLYTLKDGFADEYSLLQAQCSKAVYSYGTALFLWGMSDRTPHVIDITVPHGVNLSRLRRDNPNLRCHYIQRDFYELGITETTSPQGGSVRLYDKERCICDLIRDKDQVEQQLFTQAMKDYFKGKANPRKLLGYGKLFGVEDKIRIYMEVL